MKLYIYYYIDNYLKDIMNIMGSAKIKCLQKIPTMQYAFARKVL